MKKYQITEISSQFNHAGSKATADVAKIAEKAGFEPLYLRMNTTADTKIAKVQRQIGYKKDWKNIVRTVEDNSIVLLQHPFHYPQLTRESSLKELKNKKHVKFISVIHDVEKLRAFRYNDYYKEEFFFMTTIADVYIVHNEVMKKYFIDLGISEEKIVVLGVFDYLLSNENYKHARFEQSISIAGNLDTTKCGYIGQLGQLKNLQVHLYGSNFDEKLNEYNNITYFGSFPPDEIPNRLKSGFGLVWDGNSIEGCLGESGQYLKYNNPHKLSLYLASGLPVVIWSDAAEAEFVRKNHVGICVNNLKEAENKIFNMTDSEYQGMIEHVNAVSMELKDGAYFNRAINEACNILVK
jgi:hypothetical protein